MKRAITLLLLICLMPAFAQYDKGLDANILFAEPDNYWLKLSPNGKYIASFDNYEDGKAINLLIPSLNQGHQLVKLPRLQRLIENFHWLDNENIYFETGDKRVVASIDFSSDEPQATLKILNSFGYLLTPLPDEPDYVVYAHKKKFFNREFKLLKLTIEQLKSSDFAAAEDFREELGKDSYYFYDEKAQAMMAAEVDDDEVIIWYLPKESDDWQELFRVDGEINFAPVGFLDNETLAVLSNHNTDTRSLSEFNIKDQTFGEVLYQHPTYDLISAELNSLNSGVKSITYLDHGIPKTEYFSAIEEKMQKLLDKSFKGMTVSTTDSTADGNYRIILTHSSDNPGDYFYLDTKALVADYIQPVFQKLKNKELSKSKTFSVKASDGVMIEAILTKPVENDKQVLLVVPHGGPVGVRDTAIFNPETQFFASNGYTVLNVNFRGSIGFGKSFLDKGRGEFGQLIESDISAVVDHVLAQNNFDTVCAMGTSYGGYSSMMLAIKKPERYDCIVGMFGVYDLPHLYNASNYKAQKENQEIVAKVVGKLDDSLRDISPVYLADKIKVPVFLVAGKQDNIAPYEQSNRMKYRLKQLGKEVEMLTFENSGHGNENWQDDIEQYKKVEYFLWKVWWKRYSEKHNLEDDV